MQPTAEDVRALTIQLQVTTSSVDRLSAILERAVDQASKPPVLPDTSQLMAPVERMLQGLMGNAGGGAGDAPSEPFDVEPERRYPNGSPHGLPVVTSGGVRVSAQHPDGVQRASETD